MAKLSILQINAESIVRSFIFIQQICIHHDTSLQPWHLCHTQLTKLNDIYLLKFDLTENVYIFYTALVQVIINVLWICSKVLPVHFNYRYILRRSATAVNNICDLFLCSDFSETSQWEVSAYLRAWTLTFNGLISEWPHALIIV